MRKVITLVVTLAALACLPGRALADPVRVTGGSFDLNREGDVLGFFGFELVLQQWFAPGRPDSDLGLWLRRVFTQVSRAPGEELLGDSRAIVGAASKTEVTFRSSPGSRASDDVVPLVTAADFHNASPPFAFEGLSRGFSNSGAEVVLVSLFASGRTLAVFSNGAPAFVAQAAVPGVEDVSSTPEPGTILLFGFGAAAVARRVWSRRQD